MISARRILGALATILVAVALLALRPSGEPGVPLRDFSVYYSAGATWLAHGDAYSTAIANTEHTLPGSRADLGEMMPYFGMPAMLPVFALLARFPYAQAALIWSLIGVLSIVVILIALRSLLRLDNEQTWFAAIVLLSFVPVTSAITLGQSALPAHAAALIALACAGLPIATGIAIAISSLQPTAALGSLALLGSLRGRFAIAIGAAIVYTLGVVGDGPMWPLHFAQVLADAGSAEHQDLIQYTPASVLYGFGISPGISGIIAVGAVVAAAYGVWRTSSLLHRFAIICAAMPFVAGFFHEHNFVVLLLPLLLCLMNGRHAWVAIVASVLVSMNWLDFSQQPQGVWQDCLLALGFLCACGALTCGSTGKAFLRAAPIALAFIAVGAYVGTHHPLPIWPNDMTVVHASPTTSAAQIWKQEQLQTGLLQPDATAALLRSFALLGSALLFYLTLNIDIHEIVERRN